MWSYQHYFAHGLQNTATDIFTYLGSDLIPTVFMIGLSDKDETNHASVCFEPEEFDYYGVDINENFEQLAQKSYENSEDSEMYYSSEGQNEIMRNRHLANHRRRNLKKMLDERSPGNIHYVGTGQSLHGYDIYIIIRFESSVHDKYIVLNRNTLPNNERMYLQRSILGCAIEKFIEDARKAMYIPDAGSNLRDGLRSSSDYLNIAAQDMMVSLATRGQNLLGMHGFYANCEMISLSTYENEAVGGSLIIAKENHDAIEMTRVLTDPFDLSNHRKTLKMLRLCENDICVVTNSVNVLGLGRIDYSKYQEESESIITINFTGFHQWEAVHSGNKLLRMVHGKLEPVTIKLGFEKLYSDGVRLFNSFKKDECQQIFDLITKALAEKKGAQIIISENADKESDRLKARCFKTKPTPLTSEELTRLMRVDGGIMIDQHANLHAFGVLLDGALIKKGDTSRGARYNSALTYYETQYKENPTMIIVISDDGMVSLLPDLRPQVRHSKIKEAVNIVQKMETEGNYEHKSYGIIQDWLKHHKFYLTEDECQTLNESMEKISAIRLREHKMSIVYDKFKPHEEMNESYYLTE